MEIKDILGSYNNIYIRLKDIKNMTLKNYNKDNMYYADINTNLYNLYVETHRINGVYSYSSINDARITKDGIIIDNTKLKEELLKELNISSKDELEKMVGNDISYYDELIKNNKRIMKIINDDLVEKMAYSETLHPVRYKNKAIRNYAKLLKSQIDLTYDLFVNEDNYNKVNVDIFDEDKLKLYVAYRAINYSKRLEKGSYRYNKCIDYLKKFIDDNYEMVKSGFSFDDYNIYYVVKFLNDLEIDSKKKVDKEKPIVEEINYDFAFFEFKTETTEKFFDEVEKITKNPKANPNLKAILARKTKLYRQLPITKILRGTNKFEGYVGFGIGDYVILDKFYDNVKTQKISFGNAIYVVTEKDFEKLVTESRKDAIFDINLGLIDAVRFNHNGDYETRVINYVTQNRKYADKDEVVKKINK